MRAVVVVAVANFLPNLGIAWKDDRSDSRLYLSTLRDDRQLTHFRRWLLMNLDRGNTQGSQTSRNSLCCVTASGTWRRRLATLTQDLPVDIRFKALKEIVLLEETDAVPQAVKQAAKLLEPIANEARVIWHTLYAEDRGQNPAFRLVCAINEEITTLTTQVLTDLNVISASSASFVDSPTLESFLKIKIRTPMGKARLRAFISHPLISVEVIRMRQVLFKRFLEDRHVRLQVHGCCMNQMLNVDQFCDQLVVSNKLSVAGRKHLVKSFPALVQTISALVTLTGLLKQAISFTETTEGAQLTASGVEDVKDATDSLQSLPGSTEPGTLEDDATQPESTESTSHDVSGRMGDGETRKSSHILELFGEGEDQASHAAHRGGQAQTMTESQEKIATELFRSSLLQPLAEETRRLCKLKDLILKVFDIEALKASRYDADVLLLNPSLSGAVREARDAVGKCMTGIDDHMRVLERRLDCAKKLRVVSDSKEGRIFRVPRSIDIPSDFTLIRINKAETLFTTKKLRSLNGELRALKSEVDETERAFIEKTLTIAATYEDPLRRVGDILGHLDLLAASASALSLVMGPSSNDTWTMPVFDAAHEGPSLSFDQLCHPLLELRNAVVGGEEVISPNSVDLGTGDRRLILITGPNMGGKSTYARQTALGVYLAQLGLPVCAKRSQLTRPFAVLWTRIGADDRPSQGLSTFFTETLETAMMLHTISTDPPIVKALGGNPSLLLIDELGRGTSATDGYAFARAVMEALVEDHVESLTIFATHFHDLALTDKRHIHLMRMTKRYCDGVTRFCAQDGVEKDSDGITLAEKFGFPKSIIEEAMQTLTSR